MTSSCLQNMKKNWRLLQTIRINNQVIGMEFGIEKYTIFTGWNDKIVVIKKTTLQLYFKTSIKKINSGNLIM